MHPGTLVRLKMYQNAFATRAPLGSQWGARNLSGLCITEFENSFAAGRKGRKVQGREGRGEKREGKSAETLDQLCLNLSTMAITHLGYIRRLLILYKDETPIRSL